MLLYVVGPYDNSDGKKIQITVSLMPTCTLYRIAQIRELSLYNAQLVMVGNKVDLTESRTVTREQAEGLAQSLGVEYYETSAKDGVGVNEVFERLVILISEKITEDTKS